jgi:hypothetical protein
MSLAGTPSSKPPDPEPPSNTTIIHPTGGDDGGLIQDSLEALQPDHVLMLSGMFKVSDTLWLEGEHRTICGDPAKTSGIRSMNAGQMGGPYGAMVVLHQALGWTVRDLEFDAAGNPTELLFINGGFDNLIQNCYLHDIKGNASGQPFAAIHSQVCVRLKVIGNRVERTDSQGEGVRGIWVPSRADTVVENNKVSDTGHTAISVEGDGATIRGNEVRNVKANGTGLKIVYRIVRQSRSPRMTRPMLVTGNLVDGSPNAGIMLENCAVDGIDIDNNDFKRCGAQGTSFGALYSSSNASNIVFRNNRLDNCRSIAGLLNMQGIRLENNQAANGPATVNLEANNHDVRLTNSGTVQLGSNNSNVWVDGKKVA